MPNHQKGRIWVYTWHTSQQFYLLVLSTDSPSVSMKTDYVNSHIMNRANKADTYLAYKRIKFSYLCYHSTTSCFWGFFWKWILAWSIFSHPSCSHVIWWSSYCLYLWCQVCVLSWLLLVVDRHLERTFSWFKHCSGGLLNTLFLVCTYTCTHSTNSRCYTNVVYVNVLDANIYLIASCVSIRSVWRYATSYNVFACIQWIL